MATIEKQTLLQIDNTLVTSIGKSLIFLSQIATGPVANASSTDAETILNRKLESAGVLGTGTADPVFANESALFYLNTTNNKLFTRGTSSYDEIASGEAESAIIGHGSTDPTTATSSSPWIYIRTDQNKVWLKERTGSVGSYVYAWTGPIFEGNYRTLIVYSTEDNPGSLTATYNWQTDTLNHTGTDWTGNMTGAKWARIITATRNSNNALISPAMRLGNSTATEITTTTTNFNNNLSSANTTVQSALDTLDNLSNPLNQNENFDRISGTDLAATSAVVDQTFTVIPSLLNARTNFDEDLFLEATVHVRMQASTQLTNDKASVIFEIVTPSDTSIGIQSRSIEITEAASAVDQQIRIAGILPTTFTTGKLRTKNDGRTGNPPAIGVEGIKLEIRPDTKADEVIVERGDIGNNLTGSSDNLEEIINEIDELPIQPADYEDVEWPSSQNGIDDNATEVRRQVTFARNLQNANNRTGISYTAQITYTAQERGSRTDGGTGVNFVHKVYSNYTDGATLTEIQSSNESTTTAGQQKTVDVTVPSNTSGFWVGITNNSGQGDAKLLITNYQVNFIEGIDASRFSGNLSTATNTLQKFANAVDVLTIGSGYEQRVVFTGGNVNNATPANLGQINISNDLRSEAAFELGYPIKITAGFEVNGTIASDVKGRLYISNGTGINDLDYGGINLDSNNADNSQLIFEATLPPEDGKPTSTNVPAAVYVMLRRTAGTTAIAVDNGVVFLERDEANQILNQHQDRFDFNSGERYEDELARNFPSTSQYTINVPQSLLDVRTNETRAIRAVVRANLSFQSTGSTNIDFQIRDTAGTVLTPDVDVDENVTRTDTNSFNIETSFELPSTVTGLRLQLTKGTGSSEPNVNFNYFDGFFQIVEPNALTAQEVLTNTDAPGWSSPLTSASNNVQLALEQLAANTSSTIDASGFDGNLATTDDTLQEVAQKFDDYNPTAGATTVVSNDFSDPDNYIGGLREVTGISGVPNTPANVQQALVKADYLLQEAYNPFQSTQLLDRSTGGGFSSAFSVNNATPIYSNPVDIPDELRALGTDVAVRIRVQITALGSGFTGDIRLVDPDNRTTVFYGAAEVVNTTVYSSSAPNNFITFQRTIAAASVPDTFEVRFQRTDGGTTTTTFDNAFADVIDSSSNSGGVGTADPEPEVIWEAGPGVNDRVTSTGTRNLSTGKRFSDYRMIWVWGDNGATDREAMIYSAPVAIWSQIGPTTGHWVMTTYALYRAIRYKSDTSWEKIWATGGIRKIYGW